MKEEELNFNETIQSINMFPMHLNPMDVQFVRNTSPSVVAILLSELLR